MTDWGFAIGGLYFNIVDVIVMVLAFLAAIVGASRGFALEFSARVAFLVGIAAALIFAKPTAFLIEETFGLAILWSTFAGFLATFIIGYLLVMFLGTLLDKALDALMLDWLDRLLGFFLGIAEMLVLALFILSIFQNQSLVDISPYVQGSEIHSRILAPLAPKLESMMENLL